MSPSSLDPGAGRQVGVEQLDRHDPPGRPLDRPVDHGQLAGADALLLVVAAEPRAGEVRSTRPLREAAAGCVNRGAWPVLVGPPGSRDTLLASPIILEDNPRVAEESPGDLFDATEIDEILTLRILTLTDAEKAELRRTDECARRLLERTESLTPDELLRLHGTLRDPRPLSSPSPASIRVGDAVRLHPRPGADVLDLALRGRTARVESIERDLEDQVHVAVVLDDDPGADLRLMRMPGHRFFFRLSEVEPL